MEIPFALRLFVGIISILFTVYAVSLISMKRLQLKYALLWFALALVAFLSAAFPGPLFALSSAVGFENPSNFIFFAGFAFTLLILMSLTVVLSKQMRYIASLVQENALLRNRIEHLEDELSRINDSTDDEQGKNP